MAPHCLEEGTGWSVVAEGFNGTNWEATKEHKGIIKTVSEERAPASPFRKL